MFKVFHVVSDTNIGGAGRWILNFLKEINRDKYLTKILVPEASLLKNEIEKLRGQVVEVPGMIDRSFDLKCIMFLYRLFKKEKPDIVHTHASLSARIAAKIAGVNSIIYTKHCIDDHTKGIKARIGSAANVLLSDKIIAVSNAAKENLIESGIPEGMIVRLYNGIEKLEKFPTEQKKKIRAKWGIKDNEIVIGIVARLEEVKGHDCFIEAARLVAEQNDGIKFLIVGTGSREKALKEQVISLGLEQNIVFTGYIDNIAAIMNIIDINVIASYSEALCLSIIEGMSIGKVSIATNTGGLPEVVRDGENGLLVPVQDVQALAKAMLNLAENVKQREEMGQKAEELMNKYFTAESMTRQLEEIYEYMISKE